MVELAEAGARKLKLAAILHADVAGFSRLMGNDEAGTHRALGELRRAVDPLIAAHEGRIVGTAGDSLLADFSSVVDALACAVAMQDASRAINENVPPNRRLELRIGVNLGEVIVDGDNIFGNGVNIAQRLETLARPGAICISQTVYEQVRGRLELDYRPLGTHRVKNIAAPVRAYEVGGANRHGHPSRRFLLVGVGAAAVVLVFLVGWALLSLAGRDLRLHGASSPAAAITGFASSPAGVAVLPFRNLTGDSARDSTADGINEDVTAALGHFPELVVAARSASSQVERRNLAPAEIGRLLDARYLLEGNLRRDGDRLRFNAELTEAATGRHIGSEAYDPEGKDAAIAPDIAGATAAKLTRFEQERVLSKPLDSLTAYETVVRGRVVLSHATRSANDEAVKLLERAIVLDPNYAPAYAALAEAYWISVVSGWTEFRMEDTEKAEQLAQKALALAPNTTSAYRLLAVIASARQRYDLALAHVDRALQINPNDAENDLMRGQILLASGRPDEAVAWLERALRLDGANGFGAFQLGET